MEDDIKTIKWYVCAACFLLLYIACLSGCHAPPEPFTDAHMRQADIALREGLEPNPNSPCLTDPDSEACLNEAMSQPVYGEYGRITIDRCREVMERGPLMRATELNTYKAACKYALNYFDDDALRDLCFERYLANRRCLDGYDLDQDGLLTDFDSNGWAEIGEDPTRIWAFVESHPMEGG